MEKKRLLVCEYCGAIRDQVMFCIGASNKPDWVMWTGTGAVSCPDCWEEGKKASKERREAKRRNGGPKPMMLLTKAIKKRFEKVGRQAEEKDPIVICKFFNPAGVGTWYMTEYEPEEGLFFGFAHFEDGNGEWGYSSQAEIESFRDQRFGLPIERDKWFDEQRFSEIDDSGCRGLGVS